MIIEFSNNLFISFANRRLIFRAWTSPRLCWLGWSKRWHTVGMGFCELQIGKDRTSFGYDKSTATD